MKRLLLPALLLTTLTACTAAPAGALPAAAPTPTPASTPAPTAAPAPADALTPEEKIGQLFIIRPDALDLTLPQETINDAKADGVTMLTDAMRETLQTYPVGGICQFGKNITDPEQLAQFNADLQAASRTPWRAWPTTRPLTCRNMSAPPRWARPATRRTPAPWGRPSAHI